jgi:hypothetical protein
MTVLTSPLTEFLADRLQDQRLRGETLQAMASAMRQRGFPDAGQLIEQTANYLLADVEAKRRTIALLMSPRWPGKCDALIDGALPLLALPYASHRDYDEAWRP